MLAWSYVQVIVLAVCHLTSVGMWNGLNALGSLGTDDEHLAHYCNSTMYLAGTVGGVLGGGIVNICGIKASALIGLIGQSTTIMAYFCYYYLHYVPLPIVVAYNGLSSVAISCFTSAIGTALIHYPTVSERGKFIAVSGAILNLGGLVGGVIALYMNFQSTVTVALSRQSYLVVIAVTVVGVVLALTLLKERVYRTDQTTPELEHADIKREIISLPVELTNPFLYLLMPLFLINVWHEVVLFNYFNAQLFNIRSRAVNSCWYYVSRIAGSFLFQFVSSSAGGRRTLQDRVHSSVATLTLLLCLGCVPAVSALCKPSVGRLLDFTDPRGRWMAICFLAYGALETMSANMTFWLLAELAVGSAQSRNRLVGLSRTFINLGGCLSWSLDILHITPTVQWALNLALWAAAITGVIVATKRSTRTTQYVDDKHGCDTLNSTAATIEMNRYRASGPESAETSYQQQMPEPATASEV